MRPQGRLNETVRAARPHLERLAKDKELHAHLQRAYDSTRWIYRRLLAEKGIREAARRVGSDRKLQKELSKAIDDLRAAGARVRRRPSHTGRNATLFTLGLALAALFNPATGPASRDWL